jgi:hypothetical protein
MMPRKKPTTETNTDSPVAVATPPTEQSPERNEDIRFFERLAQFTEDEWRGLKLYVYRLWPVIDKKDSEHFLSKLSQPCDEDFLLSTFGSGKYYLRLNNSRGKTIASSTSNVYHQDHAPRVNPEEVVVSDPLNERYFKTWGKKEDPPKASAENGGNVLDFAKAAMQTAAQGNRGPALDPEVFNLFKEATKERDNLAKQLSEKQPVATVDPLAMLEKLLGTMERLRKGTEPVPQKPVDPLESLNQAMSLVERVQKINAPAPTSESSSVWASVLAAAVPALAPALAQLVQGFMMRAPSAPASMAPPRQVVSSQAGSPAPGSQPEAAAIAVPEQSPAEVSPNSLGAVLQQIYPYLMTALSQGQSGSEFASGLVTFQGEALYRVIANMGTDAIIGTIKSDPGIGSMLAPHEKQVREFVDDFIAYGIPQAEGGDSSIAQDDAKQEGADGEPQSAAA